LTERTSLPLCSFQGSRRRAGTLDVVPGRRRRRPLRSRRLALRVLREERGGTTDLSKLNRNEAVHVCCEPDGDGNVSGRRRVLEDGTPSRWESPKATSSRHLEDRAHGG